MDERNCFPPPLPPEDNLLEDYPQELFTEMFTERNTIVVTVMTVRSQKENFHAATLSVQSTGRF